MDKRMAQAYSAHQIGLKTILHAVLIAGCWCFTRWWWNFGRNFLASDFGDVLANLARTSRATDKWMLRLDSTGQKGPEIILEGILIVVERCFTAENMDRAWVNHTVSLHISRKLLAEQRGVYCHSLPGLCVRKCGTEVVVVVHTLCRRFLVAFWCCAASQYLAVSPYCAALLIIVLYSVMY